MSDNSGPLPDGIERSNDGRFTVGGQNFGTYEEAMFHKNASQDILFSDNEIISAGMKIITLIPGFVAGFVSYVFSGLIGTKGRVLQSIIFAYLAVVLVTDTFRQLLIKALPPEIYRPIIRTDGVGFLILVGIVAVWYFIWHYRAVRIMGAGYKSILTLPFTIIVFGTLLMFILLLATKLRTNDTLIRGIPFLAGAVVYFLSARPYIRFAAELKRQNKPLPPESDQTLLENLIETFTEDSLLLRLVGWIPITVGLIIFGFIINEDIVKQWASPGLGKILGGSIAVLSILVFIGLKIGHEVKVFRHIVAFAILLTALAIIGLGQDTVNGQAFPNFVYDLAKVERPAEKMDPITTGYNVTTVELSYKTDMYTKPNIRTGEHIKEIPKGQSVTTTGRFSKKDKDAHWIEVSHNGDTGWIMAVRGDNLFQHQ
jgi:hypothetical protein